MQVHRSGGSLRSCDFLGADVRRHRDTVVEDVDPAEASGGSVGDGSVSGVVQGGVGTSSDVVHVEMKLGCVYVSSAEVLEPFGFGGGDGGEEEADDC